jgi:hypothetical protein
VRPDGFFHRPANRRTDHADPRDVDRAIRSFRGASDSSWHGASRMKRTYPARDQLPGCTVRPAATSRRSWPQQFPSTNLEKANVMQIPSELKPACWGAVGGAIALAIIGFNWGGWVTGGTAELKAKQRAELAVVTALAPICVDRFRQQANADASLVELKKVNSWQQGSFIEKGGWATMPGSSSPDTAVARACAEMLGQAKS